MVGRGKLSAHLAVFHSRRVQKPLSRAISTGENFGLFVDDYLSWMKYATLHLVHAWLLIVNSHGTTAIKCTVSSMKKIY